MSEIIEIIITALFAGYILQPITRGDYKSSVIIGGLSIVAHELGHKVIATIAGFTAVYHANYSGLIFGLILRLMNAPVFFVPAYVSIYGQGSSIGLFLTAIAGPLVNLIIFSACYLLLKHSSNEFIISKSGFLSILGSINLWLGLFNLMPIPGFDGFNALMALIKVIH